MQGSYRGARIVENVWTSPHHDEFYRLTKAVDA